MGINVIDLDAPRPGLKLGGGTGSVTNWLGQTQEATPVVGMGATILMWTDSHAATIIEVGPIGKAGRPTFVTVQRDTAIRTDTNGMSDSQTHRFEPNPDGATETYTLRKNGVYARKGGTAKECGVAFGYRREYHDYSF